MEKWMVMAKRADFIEIGKKFNVPIYVKSSFEDNPTGTVVGDKDKL